ncbi:helix-turn-helix domain-containing protein [bacterium]|nr:helix-turn-helix domain-containing protein [bacterium]
MKMMEGLSTDEEFKKSVAYEIENRMISKFLLMLRCKHQLTQTKLAKKVGCSQGKISKIESSYDKDIAVGDLLNYASVLGLHLEIGFRQPSVKIVDLIKYHAFKVKMYLDQLIHMAGKDVDIKNGVARFHVEAKENIDRFISENLSKLNQGGQKRKKEKSRIHISAPMEGKKAELLAMQSK